LKYAFIKQRAGDYSIRRLCLTLKVHPSGYYAWLPSYCYRLGLRSGDIFGSSERYRLKLPSRSGMSGWLNSTEFMAWQISMSTTSARSMFSRAVSARYLYRSIMSAIVGPRLSIISTHTSVMRCPA